MDKVNSIFPLPSEWIGNFKEGWYRDNNISSKKELDEIWQERVRTIDQIYKYQRIAFEKKFAEWQQSQQPEPYGYIFNGRFYSKDNDVIKGFTFSDESKPVPVYLQSQQPEIPEGIELENDDAAISEANKIGIHGGAPLTYFISGYKAALQQKHNNNLPEQQGWVSVEDRLPKKTSDFNDADKWVLCCTGLGACLLSLCYYDHECKKWYDAFNALPETRITHWQPLPSPPNK